MVRIEMAHEGAEILREILGNHLSELRMETAHTERKEYREFLRNRTEFLEGFIRDLESELQAAGKEMVPVARRKAERQQGFSEWEL